jgi:hypothetical protein
LADDHADYVAGEKWPEWIGEARAALMAIREPDMDTSIVGGIAVAEEMQGGGDYFAAKRCWTAMIDHVLAQTPEPSSD